MPEIDKIEYIKDNEDGTKQYLITSSAEVDLRKKLFEILPKEGIVIFELKKTENTLEDAFIKLIDNSKTDKNKEKNNIEEKQNTKKEPKKVKNTLENNKNKDNIEKEEKK